MPTALIRAQPGSSGDTKPGVGTGAFSSISVASSQRPERWRRFDHSSQRGEQCGTTKVVRGHSHGGGEQRESPGTEGGLLVAEGVVMGGGMEEVCSVMMIESETRAWRKCNVKLLQGAALQAL